MTKTTRRNRFSRFTVKVYAQERIRELKALLDSALPMSTAKLEGAIAELKLLLKHWKLEKL